MFGKRPLVINLLPSFGFILGYGSVIGISLYSLTYLPVTVEFQIALGFAISVYGWHVMTHFGFLSASRAIVSVELAHDPDGQHRIVYRDGWKQGVKAKGSAYVMPWLIVFSVVGMEDGQSYPIMIATDAVDHDLHRCIRVRLMMRSLG